MRLFRNCIYKEKGSRHEKGTFIDVNGKVEEGIWKKRLVLFFGKIKINEKTISIRVSGFVILWKYDRRFQR